MMYEVGGAPAFVVQIIRNDTLNTAGTVVVKGTEGSTIVEFSEEVRHADAFGAHVNPIVSMVTSFGAAGRVGGATRSTTATTATITTAATQSAKRGVKREGGRVAGVFGPKFGNAAIRVLPIERVHPRILREADRSSPTEFGGSHRSRDSGANRAVGGEGEEGQGDPSAGFRAMTTSIAFRWGTPLEVEMNSTCPESRICQSP
jgi:hypothetical protein